MPFRKKENLMNISKIALGAFCALTLQVGTAYAETRSQYIARHCTPRAVQLYAAFNIQWSCAEVHGHKFDRRAEMLRRGNENGNVQRCFASRTRGLSYSQYEKLQVSIREACEEKYLTTQGW